MNILYNGNRIIFLLDATDTVKTVPITLPDGYSVKKMYITTSSELVLYDGSVNPVSLPSNVVIEFPVVNSKSPNTFNLKIVTAKEGRALILNIFEFGGIPDSTYFNKAFDPVLVSTIDENNHTIEYNMIPSTQFER